MRLSQNRTHDTGKPAGPLNLLMKEFDGASSNCECYGATENVAELKPKMQLQQLDAPQIQHKGRRLLIAAASVSWSVY